MINDSVIQSAAKDLDNIHVYVYEILPPFGRLDDIIYVHDFFITFQNAPSLGRGGASACMVTCPSAASS